MERACIGGREPGVGGDFARRPRQELHQAVRVGRRDGIGNEQALLPDERDHQQWIEAAAQRLAFDDGPEAERIEKAPRRIVGIGAGPSRRQERCPGGTHRAVRLRHQQARGVVADRIELAPGEAEQT